MKKILSFPTYFQRLFPKLYDTKRRTWAKTNFITIPKKGNAKECSNYHTTALISQDSKVRLKILAGRPQQYVNHELPDVQSGFKKGRGTRGQIASIWWITEKARGFQKSIYFCFIDYDKVFDCVDHNKLWKILQEREYQTTLPASWEICVQIKKQQWESDMEQQTGSKLGKEYVKAIYCHLVYLTYMQSTSCEMPGWMEQKLESRLLREISIALDMHMTSPLWQKVKRN